MVRFLQAECGGTLKGDEITEQSLGSVGAIARFLHAKYNGGGVRSA